MAPSAQIKFYFVGEYKLVVHVFVLPAITSIHVSNHHEQQSCACVLGNPVITLPSSSHYMRDYLKFDQNLFSSPTWLLKGHRGSHKPALHEHQWSLGSQCKVKTASFESMHTMFQGRFRNKSKQILGSQGTLAKVHNQPKFSDKKESNHNCGKLGCNA